MIHSLKTEKCFFDDIASGRKTFEVRKNDRWYSVGDYLALNEYEQGNYTGRAILVNVTYILNDNLFCKEGDVTMAIEPCRIIAPGGLEIPSITFSERVPVNSKTYVI